jgi:hypothetical protein
MRRAKNFEYRDAMAFIMASAASQLRFELFSVVEAPQRMP